MVFSTLKQAVYTADTVAVNLPELGLVVNNKDLGTNTGAGFAGRSIQINQAPFQHLNAHTRTDTTPRYVNGVPQGLAEYIRDRKLKSFQNKDLNTEIYSQVAFSVFDGTDWDAPEAYTQSTTAEGRALARQIRSGLQASAHSLTNVNNITLSGSTLEQGEQILAAIRAALLEIPEQFDAAEISGMGDPFLFGKLQAGLLDNAAYSGDNASLRRNVIGLVAGAPILPSRGFTPGEIVVFHKSALAAITVPPAKALNAPSAQAADESGFVKFTVTQDRDSRTGEDVVTSSTFAYVDKLNDAAGVRLVFTTEA